MKKFIYGIFMAVMTMALGVSCTKDTGTEPVISISGVSIENQTLNFSISVQNADTYDYQINSAGTVVKSETGLKPESDQPKAFTFDLQNPEATVVITATAHKGGKSTSDEYTLDGTNDPAGPQSDYFFKKVSVLEFTATWCGFCPMMVSSLHKVMDKYPGRISVIAVHCGDDIALEPSCELLRKQFKVEGYPSAIFDYNSKAGKAYNQLIKCIKEQVANYPATTDIQVSASMEGNQLVVDAEVKNIEADAKYRYACAVIENGLVIKGGTAENDTYNEVLRAFYTSENGDSFQNETLPVDTVTSVQVKGSFDSSWKKENSMVVFYTLKYSSSLNKWIVDNSNVVKIGESASYLGSETGM